MVCALSDRCVIVTNSRPGWVESCEPVELRLEGARLGLGDDALLLLRRGRRPAATRQRACRSRKG